MSKKINLSPSLLACDFARAGEQITKLENCGVEFLHLDVMDGIFVPNISFGIPVIASIRKSSKMIFDTHLMITQPERYIDDFVKAGSDYITIHVEATDKAEETLKAIKSHGVKAGISLKPGTNAEEIFPYLPLCDLVLVMSVEPGFGRQKFMYDMMPKVKKIRNELDRIKSSALLSVDGGVDKETAKFCTENGADTLVAGSAVFKYDDLKKAADDIILSC